MVPAIVLSGGRSSRMGRPKALLPVGDGGETFLSRIVRTLRAADVDDVLVVVGSDAPAITRSLVSLSLPARIIENVEHERGQLSSLQAGIAAVDRPGVRGVLVTLVDLPLVSTETVRAVLGAYRQAASAPIVRPVRAGRHGHPVVFDRALFDELRLADPAVGARPVVHAYRDRIVEVPVSDDGAFLDIDTPEDYERLIGKFPA